MANDMDVWASDLSDQELREVADTVEKEEATEEEAERKEEEEEEENERSVAATCIDVTEALVQKYTELQEIRSIVEHCWCSCPNNEMEVMSYTMDRDKLCRLEADMRDFAAVHLRSKEDLRRDLNEYHKMCCRWWKTIVTFEVSHKYDMLLKELDVFNEYNTESCYIQWNNNDNEYHVIWK